MGLRVWSLIGIVQGLGVEVGLSERKSPPGDADGALSSQGQNQFLTVLCAPNSLDSGLLPPQMMRPHRRLAPRRGGSARERIWHI